MKNKSKQTCGPQKKKCLINILVIKIKTSVKAFHKAYILKIKLYIEINNKFYWGAPKAYHIVWCVSKPC